MSLLTVFSMVTATITLLYLSYAIPVICLLVKGRNNIKHGPFWLGKIGLVSNCILLAWTLFTFVMYSFPAYRPVVPTSKPDPLVTCESILTVTDMNYISAVYGVIGVIMLIDWFVRARKDYRGQSQESVAEVERQAVRVAIRRRSSAH